MAHFFLSFSSTGRLSRRHEHSDHSLAFALPAAACAFFFAASSKQFPAIEPASGFAGRPCAFGWLAHSRNSRLRLFTEDTPLM